MKLKTLAATMESGMKRQGKMAATAPIYFVTTIAAGSKWLFGGWHISTALWWAVLGGVASYTWTMYKDSRRIHERYADRLVELNESTYHEVAFDSADEAAAFVAALARQLVSPYPPMKSFRLHSGGQFAEMVELATYEEDLEIAAVRRDDRTLLYLSDGAIEAFEIAFGRAPESRTVVGADLPPDRVAVLVGTPEKALGLDDVIKLLKP